MKVAYSATRNLYPYMLPSITSLLEHNDVEKIYLVIEDDKMPFDVPDVCECVNVSGQGYFRPDGPNSRSIYTYMAMMRITYAELFPHEDKLLQLDSDTIVCDDLTPVWEADLTGKWFAAVPEYLSRYRPFGAGIYYNIGVCLYNLAQLRADGAVPKLVTWLNTTLASCVEQDALNLFGVYREARAVTLPTRYNECFATGASDDPAVVHYAGYPNWMENRDMPRLEYLDKYRHLFRAREV